ncbi:MAG: Mur ligase family protein [Gammaproteobacteria bacterium]|nr:Mur ligase family protein [Gammaproteobacteria bacterium]
MPQKIILGIKNIYWILRGRNSGRLITTTLRNQLIISAAYLWRRLLFNTTFITITGSFGKTTTKEFIADILARKYAVSKTIGNWNHRKFKGPEMAILRTRPWHRFAVLEVGAEKPGNMESAAKFIKPDIVVITNVKRSHTLSFPTPEAVAQEKSQLLRHMRPGGCAIINQDNAQLTIAAVPAKTRIIRFGETEPVDYHLLKAESRWPERLKLTITAQGETHEVQTRLLGTHWTPTVLAALATTSQCGVELHDAIDTIRSIEPFWSRMQPVYLPAYGATIIREDSHGQLDSFEVSLKFMEEAHAKRKILVISDFSDSNLRTPARAKAMGQMVMRCADVAVFVGPVAQRAHKAALAAGFDAAHSHAFATTAETTAFLKTHLHDGDLMMIKGIMSHHLPRIYLGLIGDVKCTLDICQKQTGCDNCPELGFSWNPSLEGLMSPPGSCV